MSISSTGYPVSPKTGRSWALDKAGFPTDADIDGRQSKPGPIAIIDVGRGALGHPLLVGHTEYVPPQALRPGIPAGTESDATHAAEVAGVIASACQADLIVYNIATTAGWDRELFVAALDDILKRDPKPAVVNISVGWQSSDPAAKAAIQACIDKGISVVVATGDYDDPGDLEWFPAMSDGVIAVGGTDCNDLRLPDSNTGQHVWIAAPGEDILTVVEVDDYGLRSGTSFAAGLVSAAVWRAVRANPYQSPAQIREDLGESADSKLVMPGSPLEPRKGPSNGRWNAGVGCGRLHVPSFLELVRKHQSGGYAAIDTI